MTTTQLQQSEKQFEQAVVDYSKLMGWMSYHALDSRGSEPGFPDRLFIRPPRLLVVELKAETGRLSQAQIRWLEAFGLVSATSMFTPNVPHDGDNRRRPVESYVWKPSMWDEIQAALR